MPQIKKEDQANNMVKLTFTVGTEEAQPYLEEAAKHLSEESSIPGFRPGKAGYDVVKQRLGEMKIYETALEMIIRKSFVEAILAEDLETIGSPSIDVETLAPGNDIVFSATVALMPKVVSLADTNAVSVQAQSTEVKEEDIKAALEDLRRMQIREVRAKKEVAASAEDKAVVSMNMKREGVPIEGGQSPNHAIFLNQTHYVPGMTDEIVGMKEGETKTFTLTFPEENVQDSLAGKEVEFEVELKELFHLELPEIDELFAKGLGQESISDLEEVLKTNIQKEKEREEQVRQEKEVLEALAKKTQFEDIPDILINEEIGKMVAELKRAVESQGADFEVYLKNLKKSHAQLKLDFTPQALTRIKVALVLRAVAKAEDITASEADIDAELDRQAEVHQDEEARKQIYDPQYREYVAHMLTNRNVIAHLVEKVVNPAK